MLPCSSSPRFFLFVPWEVAGFYWRLCSTSACVLLLLFLIFFFCLFLSSCPSLPLSLCLKGSAPLDGSWGSWLLIPCRGSLFFWMLIRLGFKIPWAFLFLYGSPASATLGLAWFFLLGLTHSFGPPLLWSYLDLNTLYEYVIVIISPKPMIRGAIPDSGFF